jgi:hypothetical protein
VHGTSGEHRPVGAARQPMQSPPIHPGR